MGLPADIVLELGHDAVLLGHIDLESTASDPTFETAAVQTCASRRKFNGVLLHKLPINNMQRNYYTIATSGYR